MIRYCYWLGVLLSMVLLSGCGIRMPVTEGLVFSSSEPYGQKNEHILPFLRVKAEMNVISTISYYSPLQDAAVDDHGTAEATFLSRHYLFSATNPGFGFSYGNGRRLALGLSFGAVLNGYQVDATIRTAEKIFFTVNQLFLLHENGTELILQRPLWERKGGGVSVGAFYRRQPMQFVVSDELWSSGEPRFAIQWYGVRLMGKTPNFPGGNLHLRAYINAGYASEYRVPMVAAGMAISFN